MSAMELNTNALPLAPIQGPKVQEQSVRSITTDVVAGKTTSLTLENPERMQKQIGQAIADFDAETKQTDAAAILLKNANVLANAGDHRLAVTILRHVLIQDPNNHEALAQMGFSLRETGKLDEALKCFRALARATKSVEAQVMVAETLYLSERDEMALAAYRDVFKKSLSEPTLLFESFKNIGNIHVRMGDFEAAEEFYDKAYVIYPHSDVLLVNYGTLEIQRENFGLAVERFRRAVDINPNNDKGWVGLAMVHRLMGDRELAKANIQRALDTNGNNRTAIRLMVEWFAEELNFTPAIRRLQNYVATVGGEDAEMCFVLAKVLAQTNRIYEARVEMERVLALDPIIEGGDALKKVLDAEIARLSNQASQ